VRLVLEQCASASVAVTRVAELIDTHGQGKFVLEDGTKVGEDHIFMISDADETFVLEGAGKAWAAYRLEDDIGAISHASSATDKVEDYKAMHAGKAEAASLKELGVLAEARHVFNEFDMDKSNTIDISEFRNVCAALGMDLTDLEARKELRKIDANKDGVLQYAEFESWYLSLKSSEIGAAVFQSANAEPQAVHAMLHERVEPQLPPVPVLTETFSRAGGELHRLCSPMQAVRGSYTDNPNYVATAGQGQNGLTQQQAVAFVAVPSTEEYPVPPPPSNAIPPTAPNVFHVTSPVKPDGDFTPFSFSHVYANADDNAHGRERALRTVEYLTRQNGKINLSNILKALGGYQAELWEADESSRWHPFGRAEVTTAGSFVADIPPEPTRTPIYWCSVGTPRIGVYLPLMLCGELPDLLTGVKPMVSIWGLSNELFAYIGQLKPRDSDNLLTRTREELKDVQEEAFESGYNTAWEAQVFIDSGDNAGAAAVCTTHMAAKAAMLADILRERVVMCRSKYGRLPLSEQ